jgi:N-acetylmuramoyl-L-alanine amidase
MLKIQFHYILVILFFFISNAKAEDFSHLKVKAKSGDGAIALLKRYQIADDKCNFEYFRDINSLNSELTLVKGREYELPLMIYNYNGTSIRSTLGMNNWDLARKIQAYNEAMHKAGIKSNDYREDNILWVPYSYLNCETQNQTITRPKITELVFPIFGKEHEKVEIKSTRLEGYVYYVVAGHGGPDPGAIGKYKGNSLCEDEYAYDISLRLAKNLMENGATVYMIISDPNDGIRSEAILKADKDEVCYKNQAIPLNQVKRLNQRCAAVNSLYKKHKKEGVKKQRVVVLHVDSRGQGQRLDMFFYHSPKSSTGKKLANTMMKTIEKKYATHQKNRGYSGTVEARNLHVLRKTNPVAVFIELGNIRNNQDQKRFIIEDNRQAVANWLAEGLMNEDVP